MDNNIYDNFEDMQKHKFVKLKNRPTEQESIFLEETDIGGKVSKYRNLNRNIGYVVKRASNQQAIASIAASRMYKEIGIITPPVFLLKNQVKNSTNTIQQDVTYFDNFSTVLAADEVAFEKLDKKVFGKYKWQMFFDTELEMEFLKFMTPDCLEQLKNVFLVDEIRTDSDRHNRNYFFYRGKNSDKHEGVIAIDLEQMMIFNYCGRNKYNFKDFLVMPYASATPQLTIDEKSYIERVRDIRELMQEGVLSESNLEALLNAINYDYPGEVKRVAKERNLHGKEKRYATDPIERLWEYNRKTIGKDFGL